MSLVGKILVVAILIMSIMFMAFTMMVYSTHRNWRDLVENSTAAAGKPLGLRFQLDAQRKRAEQLQNQIQEALNKLELERAARREAISVLETRATDLQQKLIDSERKYNDLLAKHGEAIQTLDTAQAEMKRLTDEVQTLRVDIRKTREDRNEKLAAVAELTDKLNQGEGELRRLQERNTQLVEQVSRSKLVLDRNGLSEFTPVDDIPPDLDGVVTVVREGGLIEVSLGSDEGLRRGHRLDLYRRTGGYVGRVEVIDTNPDRAVARVIPEFRQGIIRKGDRVATNLL